MKTDELPSIYLDPIRLEVVMRGKGLTPTTLAQKMRCDVSNLFRIKATGRITLTMLEVMCKALECHPFDLLVAQGYPAVRLPRSGESLFLTVAE